MFDFFFALFALQFFFLLGLQLYRAWQLQFPSRPATVQRILDIVLE